MEFDTKNINYLGINFIQIIGLQNIAAIIGADFNFRNREIEKSNLNSRNTDFNY